MKIFVHSLHVQSAKKLSRDLSGRKHLCRPTRADSLLNAPTQHSFLNIYENAQERQIENERIGADIWCTGGGCLGVPR